MEQGTKRYGIPCSRLSLSPFSLRPSQMARVLDVSPDSDHTELLLLSAVLIPAPIFILQPSDLSMASRWRRNVTPTKAYTTGLRLL